MLTRAQFQEHLGACRNVQSLELPSPWDALVAHDAEQRQTIEAQAQRIKDLEKALMAEDFPTRHLIETRRCYHERNHIIRRLEAELATLKGAV